MNTTLILMLDRRHFKRLKKALVGFFRLSLYFSAILLLPRLLISSLLLFMLSGFSLPFFTSSSTWSTASFHLFFLPALRGLLLAVHRMTCASAEHKRGAKRPMLLAPIPLAPGGTGWPERSEGQTVGPRGRYTAPPPRTESLSAKVTQLHCHNHRASLVKLSKPPNAVHAVAPPLGAVTRAEVRGDRARRHLRMSASRWAPHQGHIKALDYLSAISHR